VADSGGTIHVSLHKLDTFTSRYGFKISTSKTNTMVLKEEIQFDVNCDK
jgi:hypothetical protein